jgi:membrane protein implicated in regulation of membrane protease activity
MEERKWSKRVLLRYILLQVPELAVLVAILLLVREWIAFPDVYSWAAIGVWTAKDVVLFRYVWQAYDWDHPKHSSPMIGRRGQAKERLAPSGYVQIGGELWQAQTTKSSSTIDEGSWVKVEGMRGLTLLVRPDNKEDSALHSTL